jgi:aryl-alcohol dehydrogenase-like predicted oxidoreductase
VPTPSTRSRPYRPNTRCGLATPKPRSFRYSANSASVSFHTRRSDTVCSPARFGLSTTSRKTTGAKTNPRFTGQNFVRNLAIVDEVRAIGADIGATPAQTALAWLLTRGDDIAPIPGPRRVARVEENTAADKVELSADLLDRLNNLAPAAGERHDEANMA